MKVTVAFGDVKVVVPCGHGDITIRQLSELAVTRYIKSIQQEKKSQRMFVNINALVLARDFGILDWDDNVSDVCDDRELIIARFLHSVGSCNITGNNSIICSGTMSSGNNNQYHFCSDWGNSLPFDPNVTSSSTGECSSYNPSSSVNTGTTVVNTVENQHRIHSRKNGSLLPVSTNSVDSYTYNWKIPSNNQCRNLSNERRHYQKGKSLINKRLSVDEIDSSLWPVPPPLFEPNTVITTVENTTQNITPIFTKSIQQNPLSLTYFSYPYSHSLSTDSDVTKKNPLMNVTQFGVRGSSDMAQAPSSLSSSLPSNADAKSMPQSYYSSLDSTAVSDGNNSSYDDCEHEPPSELPFIIHANQAEYKDIEGRMFFQKKNTDTSDTSNNCDHPNESETLNDFLPCTVESGLVSENYDLSDIQEEELSIQSKSIQNHDTFKPNSSVEFTAANSKRLITSPNLQLPPPMPPLRSAFTKLSPKPLNIAFHFNNVSSSDCHLDVESASDVKIKSNIELPQNKLQVNSSKSEHSIPSLFDSEIHLVEDLENDNWSTSERSADLESMATTTETSVHTTTTATNSFNTSSRNSDGLVVTLKKSVNGFGFSLTSRQNAVDLTNPVYVSKVLENGPAILDGRMKAGDRILMINDEDVRHLAQKNIKEILLNIPVESIAKIGLCRPTSDTITNILGTSNTSTIQKKNSMPNTLNHTGDEVNDECNQISVEEQKPVSFPICTCIHKQSLPCSKLNLYHFVVPLKAAKPDYLSPQFTDRSTPENLIKSLEIKVEPPAIQLHHQNKLSPCSFTNKQTANSKPPNATLGISVRRGISQMTFNDSDIVCQNTCRSQCGTGCSSKKNNTEISEKFPVNNYSNFEESSHKFCPNCHGLLSFKHGVFVKAIISNGAAHMDGRLVTGDEIIAVQGVCLYNGEEFLPPNNKVFLGDSYESLKFAQMPSQFQTRQNATSNIDSSNKPDPLNLLKQILNYAQCTSNSVSLVILRRSLEKRSCSINTLASVDANYCHNVTVEADVHTQYKREDNRGDLFNFVRPHMISTNDASDANRERIERFEDLHIKDHRQRFYRRNSDNSQEHTASTNLICLESEHESDEHCVTNSDNISNPNNSPNNNISLAESYHVSSGILTDFDEECVPIAMKSKNSDGSVIDHRLDSLENLSHLISSSSISFQPPTQGNHDPNNFLGSDLDQGLYFSRKDTSRQSFSLKRIQLNPSASSRMSKFSPSNITEKFPINKFKEKNCIGLKRPKSELFLSKVEEENSNSEHSDRNDFEERSNTIGRKVTLKRRSVIDIIELDKDLYAKFMNRTLKSIPSQDD